MTQLITLASSRRDVAIDYEAHRAAASEEALLGALMFNNRDWAGVRSIVNETHIARTDHRLIFRAIAKLSDAGGPADGWLVIDELGQLLEAAGGTEYVAGLVEHITSAANVLSYAKAVREFADRRKVVDIGEQIAARARNSGAADAVEHAQAILGRVELNNAVRPLDLVPVSAWANEPEPPPRDWVLDGLIPAGKVTSLIGNGGTGKTLAALQIGLHVSLGRMLFGVEVRGGPVLGIFCEDDEPELKRRLRSACAAEGVTLADGEGFVAISREGLDSYLCTFKRDHIRFTQFYAVIDATLASMKPRLLILDTAADLFAGDFLSTPHVRQFLKVALGGLCKRHGCAIVLLAHPSQSAIESGDGGGFSTAWNNSVRSRLYFRTQNTGDEPSSKAADRRMLELKKSNYGPSEKLIPLLWSRGAFVYDLEPIEGLEPKGARVKTTRVSVAALDFIRARYPLSLGFREIFDALRDSGDIQEGDYEERRKPLSRALRDLTSEGLVEAVSTPRGHYRAKGST